MIFLCDKCKQAFEHDGVQVVMHGQTIGHVCPECVAGAATISIFIGRDAPGMPYTIRHVEVGVTES